MCYALLYKKVMGRVIRTDDSNDQSQHDPQDTLNDLFKFDIAEIQHHSPERDILIFNVTRLGRNPSRDRFWHSIEYTPCCS